MTHTHSRSLEVSTTHPLECLSPMIYDHAKQKTASFSETCELTWAQVKSGEGQEASLYHRSQITDDIQNRHADSRGKKKSHTDMETDGHMTKAYSGGS